MRFLTLGILLLSALTCSTAYADPKPWRLGWGSKHWKNLNFSDPYLKNGKDSHTHQYDNDATWIPDIWIDQASEGLGVINGFYEAGILEDQTMKKGIPYLHVGPNFYKLGAQDQRRIAATVDAVYHVTNSENNDVFFLYDDLQDKVIGLYTKHGLQLQ